MTVPAPVDPSPQSSVTAKSPGTAVGTSLVKEATVPLNAVPASCAGIVAAVIMTGWVTTPTAAVAVVGPTPAGAPVSVTVTVSV